MKESGIFYDSANLEGFKKWFDTGILGGATTNPVILQKEGILEIPDSDMSKGEMVDLALRYRDRFPGNAVIKVPMDPRDSQKAFEVMYKLSQEGVRLNATLGISAGQLIGASEAMRGSTAQGDNYISLFWGRCDEAKGEGAAVRTLATTLKYLQTHSLATKVIIGSIRNTDQIEEAFVNGADIVTIPPKLLEEWMFTQRGLETADQFNKAYRDVREKMKLI